MTILMIYITLAIGVSFICSVLEAVLLSITPGYTQQLVQTRPKVATIVKRVRGSLDESISSILILNTFAHTVGAVGVGAQAVKIFGEEWETLIALVLTLAILYLSEIIPKTLGAKFWTKLAPVACLMILWLVKLVYPLVWVSARITRLFGDQKDDVVTREQLIALTNLGHKGGSLRAIESQYLENVLRLREVVTENICTPRSVVHMLENTTTIQDALNHPQTKSFTRIPVFQDNSDNILGNVNIRDLYEACIEQRGQDTVETVLRELNRVSEKVPVTQLLDLFIKNQSHMLLVEDEFGQTTGIVTLEDALETLLGREIVDEHDMVEDMQVLAKGMYRDKLRQRRTDEGSAGST